jgi:hypothetical protein
MCLRSHTSSSPLPVCGTTLTQAPTKAPSTTNAPATTKAPAKKPTRFPTKAPAMMTDPCKGQKGMKKCMAMKMMMMT